MKKLWNRTDTPASASAPTNAYEFQEDVEEHGPGFGLGLERPMNDRAVAAHERQRAMTDSEFDSREISRRAVKYVDMVRTSSGICRRFYTPSQQTLADADMRAIVGVFSPAADVQIMICWLPANSKRAAAPLPEEGAILTMFVPGAAIMNDGGAVVVNEKSVRRFRVARVLDTKMSRTVYTMNKLALVGI